MGKLKQCWSSVLVLSMVVIGTGAVPITYLQSAVAKGAGNMHFIHIIKKKITLIKIDQFKMLLTIALC